MSALVAVLAATLVVTSIVVIGGASLIGAQRPARDGTHANRRRREKGT